MTTCQTNAMPAGRQAMWQRIAAERPFLLRLARLQLASAAEAEDAVQETVLGALANWQGYGQRAALRGWLTGILRHKIVDAIRRRSVAPLHFSGTATEDDLDALFTADDAWHPDVFNDTLCGEHQLAASQLTTVLELCLARLPEQTARLFLMREFLGMELDEIQSECRLSAGNLRVVLYRARMRLRECVVRGWGEAA